ncbi:cell number regulator 7-like [Corylus avellana]|uniref:cell number regulator 7-like n=1 Tax=Corylus avellana TaxID=13451 RepID=UPI00286C7221|nr:cell number regulator 7-like [Corylus avellana]
MTPSRSGDNDDDYFYDGGDNVGGCMTCCFPCVTFGRIAEVLDEGKSCNMLPARLCVDGMLMLFQLQWLLSCIYREKLRSKYGLPDEPCCDCCVHFCCESCALCQEHAELKHTGLDPSKGCKLTHHDNKIIVTFFRG